MTWHLATLRYDPASKSIRIFSDPHENQRQKSACDDAAAAKNGTDLSTPDFMIDDPCADGRRPTLSESIAEPLSSSSQ
jgi:hypothetical protein